MVRRFFALAIGLVAMLAAAPAFAQAAGPNDDWQVVGRHPAAQSQSPSAAPTAAPGSGGSDSIVVACGVKARPAGEPYRTIMANLNALWGTDAHVYEPVAVLPLHARRGGCIFVSRPFLKRLTERWMRIEDPDQLTSILYAIMAHELGHVAHGDFSAARAEVSRETRELEADRFAGYSLWRLDIHFDADDTAFYYRLVGDDFVGARNSHGTSGQRAGAFKEGWDLARMGLPENSDARPVEGLDPAESAAPSAPNQP